MFRLGFEKPKRLVKTDEISSVFTFNSRFSSEHFQVLVKPRGTAHSRLAVIVSKKTARLATARNYMKRVSREVFRVHQHELHGLDIVVRVRKIFVRSQYHQVTTELLLQLRRAHDKLADLGASH